MIVFAINLAAAVALLLWAVRLIRTGVERAFLAELRRWLKSLSKSRFSAAAGGFAAALVMQSATAVALIGGGFAASGLLSPAPALAMLLGADLGSALMAMVLLLPVELIIPFVLLFGIVTFFNARTRKMKQSGRIAIGFALVLIALGMIRTATAPVAENEIVRATAAYFENDLASAFFVGALLAWAMHSSLAAVLTFATFAFVGFIEGSAAAALVLGANLGGAVIPVALQWLAPRPARMVAVANLMSRGALTLVFFGLLLVGILDFSSFEISGGQQAIVLHLTLNACLLILSLPVTDTLVRIAGRFLPETQDAELSTSSALDPGVLDQPPLALACAQRELLRMGETLQEMLVAVMDLFRTWNPTTADLIEAREDEMDRMHYGTKIYVSQLREKDMPPDMRRRAVELVAVANSMEEAADRIAVNLIALARKMNDEAITFSAQGMSDIETFHDRIVTNSQLALSVLTTGDAEAARQLVAEKDRIRREEQKMQERHLARLRSRKTASIETTNVHQDTLRLLKQVNAAITYVAYPIAEETGDLLSSRLADSRRSEKTMYPK